MRPHTRIILVTLTLLVCALMLSHTSVALRASPANIIIPQGSDGAFTIRVLDADDPADIIAYVAGDFAQLVTLAPPVTHAEGGVAINGHLLIPDDAAPGDHVQEVIIGLRAPEREGTVAAQTELAIPLIARVAYPDAYLTANWDVQSDPGSGETRIAVTLENRGRISVTTQKITIRFTDGELELPELVLAPLTIAPGAFARDDANYRVPADTAPGEYDATLTVAYADTTLLQMKPIVLGVPRLTIDGVFYDVEETGAIVPVDVNGSIVWNRPLMIDTVIFLDGASTPASTERTTAGPGAFSQRLYVDTDVSGRANASVRAVITANGVSAERSVQIVPLTQQRGGEQPLVWIVIALLVCAVLGCSIVLLWRRRNPPIV